MSKNNIYNYYFYYLLFKKNRQRLVGVAAKKFLFDIIQGAMEYREHKINGMLDKKKKEIEKKKVCIVYNFY